MMHFHGKICIEILAAAFARKFCYDLLVQDAGLFKTMLGDHKKLTATLVWRFYITVTKGQERNFVLYCP